MNCYCISLRIPAVCDMVNQWPLTTICMTLLPTQCPFSFLLLAVLRIIFKCPSLVISLEASSAASRWNSRCLHSWCVPMSDLFDVAPAIRLDINLLVRGWGGHVSYI